MLKHPWQVNFRRLCHLEDVGVNSCYTGGLTSSFALTFSLFFLRKHDIFAVIQHLCWYSALSYS